jgi:hypothetical protein
MLFVMLAADQVVCMTLYKAGKLQLWWQDVGRSRTLLAAFLFVDSTAATQVISAAAGTHLQYCSDSGLLCQRHWQCESDYCYCYLPAPMVQAVADHVVCSRLVTQLFPQSGSTHYLCMYWCLPPVISGSVCGQLPP